jgi:hypothetical protein
MRARRDMPPLRLRNPPLRSPATGWVLEPWPPMRPFHHWIGLRAGTLLREAAQRERGANRV